MLALSLLAWVIRSVGVTAVTGLLAQLQLGELLVLALANGVILLILNGRWWLLLRGQDHRIPYLTLTGHRLAAFGVSYFTPGPQFGGEPVQVLFVERHHYVPRTTAVTAVTLDKMLELLANFTFLLVGVIISWQLNNFNGTMGWQAVVVSLILLATPVFFFVATWAGWLPLSRVLGNGRYLTFLIPTWTPGFTRLLNGLRRSEQQAAQFCRQSPLIIGWALLVSGFSWLVMLGEYWLMARFLGVHLSPAQAIAALTAARLAFLLPLPGGLGTLEASQAFAFSAMGFDPAVGVSLSLLIRLRDVTLGLLGLWWVQRNL